MNKALVRPQHEFFSKQQSVTPAKQDRYQQWCKQEDKKLLAYIDGLASDAAKRKVAGKPFKRPNLKGFELRFFDELLNNYVEGLQQ
jgi:hypothetical protein